MIKRREFITLLGGAAAAWPLAAHGQERWTPIIGFLSTRTADDSASVVDAFQGGLGSTGYLDGRNVRIEFRWAEGRSDRLPTMATELVSRSVAVIAAVGGDEVVRAAQAATATIPIIFITGSDPARVGLVASLNRPGGNTTGVTLFSTVLEQKKLEVLRELVPTADTFGVLLKPGLNYDFKRSDIEIAARTLGRRIHVLDASTEHEIEAAFDAVVQKGIGALLVTTDPFFSSHRQQILTLAARHKVPAIYDSRIQVEAGGLVSYGASYTETYRQGGIYVGRILNGARPADLPVLLPTKFELVLNLKTAKALGLEVPPSLLARADEVIE
jgi:putative tryptophan/tyrosine transport system substrate-binding protein